MAISFTRKGSDGHFFCQGSSSGAQAGDIQGAADRHDEKGDGYEEPGEAKSREPHQHQGDPRRALRQDGSNR